MIATRVIEQPSSYLLVVLTSIVTDHLAPCMIAFLFLAFHDEHAVADGRAGLLARKITRTR
jgi:hypothetical protein